ncbi:MAG: hypothetical protein CSA09_00635 [Candidatus Contendobacter odensis]|uniref:AMP-dependent synthetase/ligase domain-containing protein n=1 Tax=Candidatus Contendibacter odensensis TaxID=1400860 RepID=A0A2G6PFU6_9GAMM|nr:MAG: hypothetical protein CSA09_00635 [Candidatus Contendobacter odensis]
MSATLPLLSSASLETPLARRHQHAISRAQFLRHIHCVIDLLPPTQFVVNLCQDRYLFMVAFAAVGVNGQTNLLPSSRADLPLQQLTQNYPDSTVITDADLEQWLARQADHTTPAIPELPARQLIAIAFTSGSTGRAKPHLKYWHALVGGAKQAQQRFGFNHQTQMVATVPPQHMYGLETSIMAPLVSGISVHTSRPFFPEDVRVALSELPPSRILVTTPVHLQACVDAELNWPAMDFVISATAPLSTTLAQQAEQCFSAPVREIYGCTEAGSIASRRTLDGDRWCLYEGFHLHANALSGAHLSEPVTLCDRLEICNTREFKLLGRSEDSVNIAGKRNSLAYLNHQINTIEGVVEGHFALPDEADGEISRLVAVVVAPTLSEPQILAELARRLDPVFLPRPLIKVAQLPRNETGKITRDALLTLTSLPSAKISPTSSPDPSLNPADRPEPPI